MREAAQFIPQRIELTDEQRAIQTAPEDTIIVEANAGAAKTTTLALRLAEAWKRGIAPRNCLALTYTPVAKESLTAALKKIGVPVEVVRQFQIETFESFAATVLLELEGTAVSYKLDAEDLMPFVWMAIDQVADNIPDRWRDDLVIPSHGDNGTIEEFLRFNLRLKGTMHLEQEEQEGAITPADAVVLGQSFTMLRFFMAYENIRRGTHLDHPTFRGPFDATYDLARIIRMDTLPRLVRGWPTQLHVLLVDEMHDVNQAMFLVLRKLLKSNPCYFCGVGDVDQVIYASAGADSRFMGGEIAVATARRIKRYSLTASFRFAPALAKIVAAFKRKKFLSASDHATVIMTKTYGDAGSPSCEVSIVEDVKKWKSSQRKLSNFAVLLRHSHQSIALENALLAADIPYTVRGFNSYLMRPEILLVRGLLAIAADKFTSIDDLHTRRRIVEAFVFFCGVQISAGGNEKLTQRELIDEAIAAVAINPLILASFFENQVLKGVTDNVARRLRAAVAVAREDAGPTMLPKFLAALRIDLLAAGVLVEKERRDEAARNLEGLRQSAERHQTAAAFFQSLNEAETKQRLLKSSASLTLASVSSVKGLEFDSVALPYLRQGEFPSVDGLPLEEDNLFYVGITRARMFLHLYVHEALPSAFISRLQ